VRGTGSLLSETEKPPGAGSRELGAGSSKTPVVAGAGDNFIGPFPFSGGGCASGTKQKAQPRRLSLFLFLLYKFRISDWKNKPAKYL
jgi:hypothetical protein